MHSIAKVMPGKMMHTFLCYAVPCAAPVAAAMRHVGRSELVCVQFIIHLGASEFGNGVVAVSLEHKGQRIPQPQRSAE